MNASIIGKECEPAVTDLKQSECILRVSGNTSLEHMARQRRRDNWTEAEFWLNFRVEKRMDAAIFFPIHCWNNPALSQLFLGSTQQRPLVTERTTEAGTYWQQHKILREPHHIISILWHMPASRTCICLCTPYYWLKDCPNQHPHKSPWKTFLLKFIQTQHLYKVQRFGLISSVDIGTNKLVLFDKYLLNCYYKLRIVVGDTKTSYIVLTVKEFITSLAYLSSESKICRMWELFPFVRSLNLQFFETNCTGCIYKQLLKPTFLTKVPQEFFHYPTTSSSCHAHNNEDEASNHGY